ncbi:MAG TPA: class I SAM-dependent methyltransferase [Candidatus Angelobacter sp.]|nr:class I SAM-dependent methyltransferase [Candidatus Angelobacter sp.]
MRSLAKLQRNWERLAQTDPLWSICADPEKHGGRWTHEELFATGRVEVATVMGYLRSLGFSPDSTAPALDFGCGIGRLTRALAQRFPECWGVDISPTMIRLAEELHRGDPRCKFWLNATDHLRKFPPAYFGFIYTSITLPHIPKKHVVNYLKEFARVLRPKGILVFQVADSDRSGAVLRAVKNVVGFFLKWKRVLGRDSVTDSFYMDMHCMAEKEVRGILLSTALRIVDVKLTNSSQVTFNGDLRFLEREPQDGSVSKQYCAVRK